MKHEVNDNGRRIGAWHPRARHTDRSVELMLRANEDGVSSASIAKTLGIPASTVRSVVNGQARRQTPSVEARGR